MVSGKGDRRKTRDELSVSDWCRAALLAFGERGERAFAVEPLARSLGVTKGSFYWHFESRAELLEKSLKMWEELGTRMVIESLEEVGSPAERLHALFDLALRDPAELRAEAALQAAAARGHDEIGPVVARVNATRLAYLSQQYVELGRDAEWADAAYASYLGACQLASMEPAPLDNARRRGLVARLQAVFAGSKDDPGASNGGPPAT